MKHTLLAASLLSSFVLFGCGGGGGSDDNPTPPVSPEVTPPVSPEQPKIDFKLGATQAYVRNTGQRTDLVCAGNEEYVNITLDDGSNVTSCSEIVADPITEKVHYLKYMNNFYALFATKTVGDRESGDFTVTATGYITNKDGSKSTAIMSNEYHFNEDTGISPTGYDTMIKVDVELFAQRVNAMLHPNSQFNSTDNLIYSEHGYNGNHQAKVSIITPDFTQIKTAITLTDDNSGINNIIYGDDVMLANIYDSVATNGAYRIYNYDGELIGKTLPVDLQVVAINSDGHIITAKKELQSGEQYDPALGMIDEITYSLYSQQGDYLHDIKQFEQSHDSIQNRIIVDGVANGYAYSFDRAIDFKNSDISTNKVCELAYQSSLTKVFSTKDGFVCYLPDVDKPNMNASHEFMRFNIDQGGLAVTESQKIRFNTDEPLNIKRVTGKHLIAGDIHGAEYVVDADTGNVVQLTQFADLVSQ